jgi:hypothetical protein
VNRESAPANLKKFFGPHDCECKDCMDARRAVFKAGNAAVRGAGIAGLVGGILVTVLAFCLLSGQVVEQDRQDATLTRSFVPPPSCPPPPGDEQLDTSYVAILHDDGSCTYHTGDCLHERVGAVRPGHRFDLEAYTAAYKSSVWYSSDVWQPCD